jgi:hypothetical protein
VIIAAFLIGLALGQFIGLFVGWELSRAPVMGNTSQMGQRSAELHKLGLPGAAPGSAIGT